MAPDMNDLLFGRGSVVAEPQDQDLGEWWPDEADAPAHGTSAYAKWVRREMALERARRAGFVPEEG